jgi:hypothetical protein
MNCREGIKGLESDDILIAEFGEAGDVSEGDFRERLLRISSPIETTINNSFLSSSSDCTHSQQFWQ